jgi:uncharacterized membrane protein (UPF0127 family)
LATKTKLIVNLTRGGAVCVGELADRPAARMRGLMGRRGLPAGEGLLLSPAPAIHTAFMRFPIDALFLDRDLRVLKVVERLAPWRIASERRAHSVLELTAGESARRGVKVDDRLELRDRSEADGEELGAAEYAGAEMGEPSETAVHAQDLRQAQDVRQGELARLRPLRILIVSSDNRFRTVMSLLLARRNCSVTTTANAGRIVELIARESTDVAVIDTGELPLAATLATVDTLACPVGVVLVGDETTLGPSDEGAMAKWGPFGELVEAIERADRHRGIRVVQP